MLHVRRYLRMSPDIKHHEAVAPGFSILKYGDHRE